MNILQTLCGLFCGIWLVVLVVSFVIIKKHLDSAPIGYQENGWFYYGKKEKK